MNEPNRRAQNNVQILIFLAKSLTNDGHIKIVKESDRCRANRIAIGTLYFKLLMTKAVLDTRATASHLRENLTSLESYMASVNSNLELFNLHVKGNIQGIKAREERTHDLMTNLFKGHMDASDKDFVS